MNKSPREKVHDAFKKVLNNYDIQIEDEVSLVWISPKLDFLSLDMMNMCIKIKTGREDVVHQMLMKHHKSFTFQGDKRMFYMNGSIEAWKKYIDEPFADEINKILKKNGG